MFAVQERLFSRRLSFYLDNIFQDISFDGKTVLDIGGGAGLFSFYTACMGAQKVLCLEPEAEGSDREVVGKFKKFQSYLRLPNVELIQDTLQNFTWNNELFDIIILHNSINHLNEEACIHLRNDRVARETYIKLFQKISHLANVGAKIIVVDSSRHNIFSLFRIKNPLAPTIQWHKHQSPKVWAGLLSSCGFGKQRIRWLSFNRLGAVGKVLLGNKIAAYFLNSYFCLIMDKCLPS